MSGVHTFFGRDDLIASDTNRVRYSSLNHTRDETRGPMNRDIWWTKSKSPKPRPQKIPSRIRACSAGTEGGSTAPFRDIKIVVLPF